MRSSLNILICALTAILIASDQAPSDAYTLKKHDVLPRHEKLFMVVDQSVTMNQECPDTHLSRLSVAVKSLKQFYNAIPTPPLWQYGFLTSLITSGDPGGPKVVVPLQTGAPWLVEPYYKLLVANRPFHPWASSTGEALEFCAGMGAETHGNTAVVLFTDGETSGKAAQLSAQALKHLLGDSFRVFGVFVGDSEHGWRNLFKLCRHTGGYVRSWRELIDKKAMADFVRDILVQEISFHYVEIFFQANSANLLPSEAGKLEKVADFLQLIPHYVLVIDGYSIPGWENGRSLRLAMQRAEAVRKALISTYNVSPKRIMVRSIGNSCPRYTYEDPGANLKNAQAVLYLKLPLRNSPYDEKHMHTFGLPMSGVVMNDRERNADDEWAWPLPRSGRSSR